MTISPTLTLNNGVKIPRLGLGVFRAHDGMGTREAVNHALSIGYRHIDTAKTYGNEAEVGAGVRDFIDQTGSHRDEVFVTTKLWNDDQGYDETLHAFDASIAALGLEHIDLYLMHWPVPGRRLDSWRAMETIYNEGRCRAIGVSNFTVRHLAELLDHANVVPAVNQVELHPFCQQRALAAQCAGAKIRLTAYSPLTKGRRLEDPRLIAVAQEIGRTPAQTLIRWVLEKGFVAIPKSADPSRIEENSRVFDFTLTSAQITQLDALEENLHTAWDPTETP